jgi:DNA-binding MarR family transcriptional regulator
MPTHGARLSAIPLVLRKRGGCDLFGDPALEMLLHLVVADRDRRSLSLKSLARATATPPSSAVRWVERLVSAGCVERTRNCSDKRVLDVALTDHGRDVIRAAAFGLCEC